MEPAPAQTSRMESQMTGAAVPTQGLHSSASSRPRFHSGLGTYGPQSLFLAVYFELLPCLELVSSNIPGQGASLAQ